MRIEVLPMLVESFDVVIFGVSTSLVDIVEVEIIDVLSSLFDSFDVVVTDVLLLLVKLVNVVISGAKGFGLNALIIDFFVLVDFKVSILGLIVMCEVVAKSDVTS